MEQKSPSRKKHHNYCVNHRYDSKPHSPHVVEVISANIQQLHKQCLAIIRQQSTLDYNAIFADALIRCANDLALSSAPDSVILSRFVELFRTTIIDECFNVKKNILVYAEFNGNRGVTPSPYSIDD